MLTVKLYSIWLDGGIELDDEKRKHALPVEYTDIFGMVKDEIDPAAPHDMESIRGQYKFLNSPMQPINGPALRNLWLDDNIDIWRQILFMPRNGMKISLKQLLSDKRIDNPSKEKIITNDPDHKGVVVEMQ